MANVPVVSIRSYKIKAYGQFEPWLKMKYLSGCNHRSIDMPEARARELLYLLDDYFNQNQGILTEEP